MADARAFRVDSRSQLIGGPRALGEVGDWMLENDKVRFVIQDSGFSRGFGVYGGALIDADIVRPQTMLGDSSGAEGHDNFGEMFPAFFLQALEPKPFGPRNNRLPPIAVESNDDGSATVIVRGYGADFLALTKTFNELLLNDNRNDPQLEYETRYTLRPGASYLEISTKITNVRLKAEPMKFPGADQGVPVPLGDVMLFGAGNKVFLPHEAGFDIRYRLEHAYADGGFTYPALPGLVADFVASESEHVSYALMAAPPEAPTTSYPGSLADQFDGAKDTSVHIPFIASAFTGVFQANPPDELPQGESFTFTRYFMVGDGDVASVAKIAYDLMDVETGEVEGRVLQTQTNQPLDHGRVVFLDESGKKVSATNTTEEGRFKADLPPGTYLVQVVAKHRNLPEPTRIEVKAGESAFADLNVDAPAIARVSIVDAELGAVPGKATLVGTADVSRKGMRAQDWLFDLSLGESWHYTDFVTDTDDPATRQYVEAFAYATADGAVDVVGRPGTYELWVSRGPEMNPVKKTVTLKAGETTFVEAKLEHAFETPGYVSADFHLHSQFSLDSDHSVEDRLLSYAGEGLEFAVSTDHNFVVDYAPLVTKLGLDRVMGSAIGLELTTLDRGHFNGFPLRHDAIGLEPTNQNDRTEPHPFTKYSNTIASRTFGSFEWARATPGEIFDSMRALHPEGMQKDDVVVQINHPRAPIMGYFGEFGVDQETLAVNGNSLVGGLSEAPDHFKPENFSWDFDAIEVFNGKEFEVLHNYRVPEGVTVDPVTMCPVVPGEPVREWQDPANCVPGEIAYPGVVDDWFALLSTGQRVVGLANSDSHHPNKNEPGTPRSYVRVRDDRPDQVTARDISAGVKSGQVLMTNGPFVEVEVEGTTKGGMSDTVSVDGTATVRVRVQTASHVEVDELTAYVVSWDSSTATVDVAPTTVAYDAANDGTWVTIPVDVPRDGFLVVRATGSKSLFPVIYPEEVPPLEFNDVIAAVGGSLGLGTPPEALQPGLLYQTTPYALTNPVWLDGDGDGELAGLRPDPRSVEARVVADRVQKRRLARAVKPVQNVAGPIDLHHHGIEGALERAPSWMARMPKAKLRELEHHLPAYLWPSEHPADARRIFLQFMCQR